ICLKRRSLKLMILAWWGIWSCHVQWLAKRCFRSSLLFH
ncbi:hypothetical protein Csa_023762, partial [Cucumis sativus]